MNKQCIFCHEIAENNPNIYLVKELFIAKWDPAPVSKGHSLIIPIRHVNTLDELTDAEMVQLRHMLTSVKRIITDLHQPDGFNYGINEGRAAGQSIPHLHMHVIPRYEGDVPNPKGGVRNLMANTTGEHVPPASVPGYDKM